MKLISRALILALLLGLCTSTVRAEPDVVPDVVYGHKDGMALTFDVFKPQDANGAGVLFMVSGGWVSKWYPPPLMMRFVKPLVDGGFTVFTVRHGSSPKYKIPEIVEDVRRSVRFIRSRAEEFGVDSDRLGVFGGSAGGHLTLMLATASDPGNEEAADEIERVSDRIAAVVAYYPPTDLRGLVNEPPNESKRFPALNFEPAKAVDYSPIAHVSPDDPPTLLIHGDQDDLVPLEHSTNMLETLKEHNIACNLVIIEGAGHGFQGDDQQRASEALVNWFQEHLGTK